MTIILPDRAAHWYFRNGFTCHQVQRKDGKGLKNTGIRDARERDLLPSVTNILSIKSKPAIVDYKVKQALMAAATLPKIEGETEDAFMERVVVDMEAHQRAAAEFGTRIHKYCESIHQGIVPLNEELAPYVFGYYQWFGENVKEVLWAERVLVNEKVGYAGTADLLLLLKDDRKILADIKTQGIKERITKTKGTVKNDPAFYPEWYYQLVSYGQCLEIKPDGYMSIVIDSVAPGPCHCYEWPLAGRRNAWRSFLACCWLWFETHHYFPSTFFN